MVKIGTAVAYNTLRLIIKPGHSVGVITSSKNLALVNLQ
jgi:hypothetical protein